MRVCTKCKVEKPFTEFHKQQKKKSGYREVCKLCRRSQSAEAHLKKDLQLHILNSAKARAHQLGVPFNLEYDDITPPDTCPVFGFPLQRHRGGGGMTDSPSIDRIIPEKGYVKGNIQIISNLANTMKNRSTPQQLEAFALWVLKNKNETSVS